MPLHSSILARPENSDALPSVLFSSLTSQPSPKRVQCSHIPFGTALLVICVPCLPGNIVVPEVIIRNIAKMLGRLQRLSSWSKVFRCPDIKSSA